MARQKGSSPPVLQSVAHALTALDVLGAGGELGVNDLARSLGVPPPNAYRLLSTLTASGYAEQDPLSRKYRLGIKLLELGQRVRGRLRIREIAHPALQQLVVDTRETAFLAVLGGPDVVVIEVEESSAPIYASLQVGMRCYAPSSAAGQVLLAFGDPGLAEEVLARGQPAGWVGGDMDPGRWLQELSEVRRRGYATTCTGLAADTAGVAAPVFDHEGKAIAAAGICALTSRPRARDLEALVCPVLRAGRAISRALGYRIDAPGPTRS